MWEVTVSALHADGEIVRVGLEGPFEATAIITQESLDHLDLRLGSKCWATIKQMNLMSPLKEVWAKKKTWKISLLLTYLINSLKPKFFRQAFLPFGGKPSFYGQVETVTAPEDNSFVRKSLEGLEKTKFWSLTVEDLRFAPLGTNLLN